MQSSSFTFASDDGLDIFVRKWMPEPGTSLNGIVQISHGLAEHGRRYGETASRLTAAGYGVFANDHRGHGRSVIESRDFGFFGRSNGWIRAAKDIHRLSVLIKRDYADIPLVLFGHSMGAQLAQKSIMEEARDLAGVVLSGATGTIGLTRYFARIIARVEWARLGECGRSKLLHALSFGSFNRKFSPARTLADWLSRDEDEVDDYIDDPLCGFVCTTQLWLDMLDATASLQEARSYKWTPQELPVYIMSGGQDPVSNGGRALIGLVSVLRKAGIQDIRLKIYSGGRHELLHETNREEVVMDLIQWLDEVVGAPVDTDDKIVLPAIEN
ncbi:MAG TPA: alpha/beta hydrolase [Sneathiellales bacterium]|nr:alpha/beta hydrolase [Sneathiellales bacterium]